MRLAVHAPGDPFDCAEQVDQHRVLVGLAGFAADRLLEDDRGSAFGDEAGLDLGRLQFGIDRHGDALQASGGFEAGEELA
jgi:hypothetical protein